MHGYSALFFSGQCLKKQDIPNDFECKCMSPFRGKFCEYGKFCTEEKCKNNGTCIEGPYSMVCNCLAGFEGLFLSVLNKDIS